jgi:hypothetical protein
MPVQIIWIASTAAMATMYLLHLGLCLGHEARSDGRGTCDPWAEAHHRYAKSGRGQDTEHRILFHIFSIGPKRPTRNSSSIAPTDQPRAFFWVANVTFRWRC